MRRIRIDGCLWKAECKAQDLPNFKVVLIDCVSDLDWCPKILSIVFWNPTLDWNWFLFSFFDEYVMSWNWEVFSNPILHWTGFILSLF